MINPLRIALFGAGGRMGAALARLIANAQDLDLVARVDIENHPAIGESYGGVPLTSDIDAAIAMADVVIDFAAPGSTHLHAEKLAQAGKGYIVGTTGLDSTAHTALDDAATASAIVQAGNFSTGVALLTAAVKFIAEKLPLDEWDIEITDRHHRHKVDSPSGTALMLGEAAANARGLDLDVIAQSGRDGLHGERKSGDIGFNAVRGGAIIGEHDVDFLSVAERITISHKAENRDLFALGALHAARFVGNAKPGRYTIQQVLGIRMEG